jgi:hypothetical protein
VRKKGKTSFEVPYQKFLGRGTVSTGKKATFGRRVLLLSSGVAVKE